MKLTYRIIWFEDVESAYKQMKPDVVAYVEELGFIPDIIREDKDGDFDKYIGDNDIDLIIVDYKLAQGTKGDQLIKRIREHDIYTEIIFYSVEMSKSALEKLNGIDGIFYSFRDDLVVKVKKVIDLTLRKIQDVNMMRGLVIAETSDLDNLMKEIIQKHFTKLKPVDSGKLANQIQQKLLESISAKKSAVEKVDVLKDIKAFLDSYHFESSHKWRTTKEIIESLNADREFDDVVACLNQYNEEVIELRNKLAHVHEEVGTDGKKVLKGTGGFIFNDGVCKDIRNKLKKHSTNFKKINDVV